MNALHECWFDWTGANLSAVQRAQHSQSVNSLSRLLTHSSAGVVTIPGGRRRVRSRCQACSLCYNRFGLTISLLPGACLVEKQIS